jgi:hypothetical protein
MGKNHVDLNTRSIPQLKLNLPSFSTLFFLSCTSFVGSLYVCFVLRLLAVCFTFSSLSFPFLNPPP